MDVRVPSTATERYPKLGISVKDGQPDLTDILITFERTRCFVGCPAYALSVSGDGTGSFRGNRWVRTFGPVDLKFESHLLGPVLDTLEECDFLALNHKCCWDPSGDSSNATLVLSIAGRAGSFSSQMPCPFDLDTGEHAELHRRIEMAVAELERVVGVERLVGTHGEATPFGRR